MLSWSSFHYEREAGRPNDQPAPRLLDRPSSYAAVCRRLRFFMGHFHQRNSCTCTFQVHVTERAMQPSIIAPVGPVEGGFLSIAESETYLVQSVNFGVVRSG